MMKNYKYDNNAIDEVLLSIALEEKGLAALYEAEADKIKKANELWENGCISTNDLLGIQNSVEKILKIVLKSQMLLQFKLDSVIEKKKDVICLPPTKIITYNKYYCCNSSCNPCSSFCMNDCCYKSCVPYQPCYINNCCIYCCKK